MSVLQATLQSLFRAAGFEVVRYGSDRVTVARYLCPSGHKLFDFRREPGFQGIATMIINEKRTSLDYNRLFVLWQAVRNTCALPGAVAEVGSFRGGSARFLAAAFAARGSHPPVHVIDTFQGHPEYADVSRDVAHTPGRFSDTDVEEVRAYLSDFTNVTVHQGTFEGTSAQIADLDYRLIHIDVDIYRTTANCLRFFWPRLIAGGAIVVDDYGFTSCPGLKQAVDEFVAEQSECRLWYVHTGQAVLERGAI
jgi:O-methyltransferase